MVFNHWKDFDHRFHQLFNYLIDLCVQKISVCKYNLLREQFKDWLVLEEINYIDDLFLLIWFDLVI